ncbi:phosphatidylglycerophosphatase A [Candidatus Binatia bacterium]|nr:phosphatidylglycerophosphatase A [Candidatus Binatia bacterium]
MVSRGVILFLASGAGLGYAPFASGTFGSLLGIVLYLALLQVTTSLGTTILLLSLLTVVAIAIAGRADAIWQEHDSGRIVIDEIVGMAIALAGFPPTWTNVVALFVLFRVLDIVKLWPASWFDRKVPGGAGVVLDDVVSGIYANLLANLVARILL